MGKTLGNKYGKRPLDSAQTSPTDAIKIVSERAIQKTGETSGDLIGNKIEDKITNI